MAALLKYVLWYFIFKFNFFLAFSSNSCERQATCSECIRDPSICVWCAYNNHNGTRCKSRDSLKTDWCPEDLQNLGGTVQLPKSGYRKFSYDPGNIIQIEPQKYEMLIRAGESVNFTFAFKGVKDYPVDLYFLMDASKSMKVIKDTMAEQSENIYHTMKNFTSNVYLGMGTFIEKNLQPFAFRNSNSTMTYAFKNRLKLTSDIKEFQSKVTSTTFGLNRDPPESGLDALAQVIVCKDAIGWRTESRKIVVLLTDGQYHAAGDGRNAGLFEPYDGKCYTENDTYTKETEMDYPSTSMINKLVKENEIIVIFLVDGKTEDIYRQLSGVVSGSKTANYDAKDSIVKTIKEVYEDITKQIKLKVNTKTAISKNIQITFDPDCTNVEINNCKVKTGQEKKFIGTLKLLNYDGLDKFSLDVAIEGISEKLALNVRVLKDCDCGNTVKNSSHCYGEPRECGICKCGDKRYGDRCACVKSVNNPFNDNSTCIAENSEELCSGHGSCFCGSCQCRERFEGQYCQCNMDSCPRAANGIICNDNGKCDCGNCSCNTEWSGKACDCLKDQTGCKTSNDNICNNRGTCVCGNCDCNKYLADWDQRKSQDTLCHVLPCPECHSFQCRHLDKYASCLTNTELCDDDGVIITTVKTLENYTNSIEWHSCPDVKVSIGCYTRYVYKYNDDNYSILMVIQEEKDCIESHLVFGGVFFITLLLVGLFTLIAWKVLAEARDLREYNNFMKQHKEELSEQYTNPLYEPATTTVVNPAFRKPSVAY